MLVEIIGWVGTLFVLTAYILVETQKITPHSKQYQVLNIAGAMGILINAFVHHAIPSVGLNIIWIFIAVFELTRRNKKRKSR